MIYQMHPPLLPFVILLLCEPNFVVTTGVSHKQVQICDYLMQSQIVITVSASTRPCPSFEKRPANYSAF